MEMEARRAFAASQEEVWDCLHDPEVIKSCLSGCEKFEAKEPGHHVVDWVIKLGAGSARFDGNVYLMESVSPERYRVEFDGEGGVAGSGKGTARARLIPLPDYAPGHPRCQLHYSVNATLQGNITKVDSRLVDAAAQTLAEQFFRRFDEQLKRRYPRAAPAHLNADPSDMDDQERAGAPTMLLDRSARAATPQRVQPPEPAARRMSVWVWGVVAGVVVLAGGAWLVLMR